MSRRTPHRPRGASVRSGHARLGDGVHPRPADPGQPRARCRGRRRRRGRARCSCSTMRCSPPRTVGRTGSASCSSRSPTSTRRCAGSAARSVVRAGSWVDEVLDVAARDRGASTIHLAADHSSFARRRLDRLTTAAAESASRSTPTRASPSSRRARSSRRRRRARRRATAAPRRRSTSTRSSRPYHRAWLAHRWREVVRHADDDHAARRSAVGSIPALAALTDGDRSPDVIAGGETEAHRSAEGVGGGVARGLRRQPRRPRRRPHLADLRRPPPRVPVAARGGHPAAAARRAAAPFVRQLCWRDFYHQVLAARPDAAHDGLPPAGDRWNVDDDELAGVEGRPHRLPDRRRRDAPARVARGSCTTGPAWSSPRSSRRTSTSTGASAPPTSWTCSSTATSPTTSSTGSGSPAPAPTRNAHRVFNPLRQAERFDPTGDYIRRYVPELDGLPAKESHDPPPEVRAARLPAPIVDPRRGGRRVPEPAELTRRRSSLRWWRAGGPRRSTGGGRRRDRRTNGRRASRTRCAARRGSRHGRPARRSRRAGRS